MDEKIKKATDNIIDRVINYLVEECHLISTEKGFYDDVNKTYAELQVDERFIGTQIALMHSELSEALEALRDNKQGIYYKQQKKGFKPEGMVVELADCIIRIFDLCGALNLKLGKALREKIDYNRTRDYKHGRENF